MQTRVVAEEDPTRLNLDVYDTKDGLWNPDYGSLEVPVGWQFLPSGDAFVTRRVKAAGAYWTLWRPRGANRGHRRKLGLVAPRLAIEAAVAAAERTAERRARQRVVNAGHRDRVEADYRKDFSAAVVAWLDFSPEHAAVADAIARSAADRAVVVGSGRVGRTKTLTLEQRAELAARATIRHRFTAYEDRLVALDPFEAELDDYDYRLIRREAHDAVDAFLAAHRPPDG